MMNLKATLCWFYEQGINYNAFISDVDGDIDSTDGEGNDPTTILKHKKYATRLYIVLLIVCVYILLYATLINSESKTIVVSNINRRIYDQLYVKHGTALSCPCSTVAISYQSFVKDTISFHPVCSSYFVGQQWIKALYLSDANRYGVGDFRTTASAQFQILSSLCSVSKDMVRQKQINLNQREFITLDLIPEMQMESEVNATRELVRNSLLIRLTSFIAYLRVITRSNYLMSGLNTNALVSFTFFGDVIQIFALQTELRPRINPNGILDDSDRIGCAMANPTTEVGFDSAFKSIESTFHAVWHSPKVNSTVVNGFFTGCFPFEALLKSTLSCLYSVTCLEVLADYFLALEQMNLNMTNYILSGENQNRSLDDYLSHLFINEWSAKMNYSTYFDQCNPVYCTYTTETIKLSYTFTLFISLSGGLIVVLRFLAPFLIQLSWKFRHVAMNTFASLKIYPNELVQSMKKLNLFKVANKRTENDIGQQRITTRVYLVFLTASVLTLLFFNSFSVHTTVVTELNPSLTTYKNLEVLYSGTLKCPCSVKKISYQTFISLSPVLHQVCSSDFLTDKWFSILKLSSVKDHQNDWRSRVFLLSQLLSQLCQLANNTINNAVSSFRSESFLSTNLPAEIDFSAQMNATLDNLLQSTIISFDLLVNTVNLLLRVDRPLMGSFANILNVFTIDMTPDLRENEDDNLRTVTGTLHLTSMKDMNADAISCICATNPDCQVASAIYNVDFAHPDKSYYHDIAYVVPGSVRSCSYIDSLLFSTLECYYSTSDCFSITMKWIKETYYWNAEDSTWFDVQPLTHDPLSSRYSPNTSVSAIIKNLMMEKLNSSFSYNQFFEACAPDSCTYSRKFRSKAFIEVLITLVSMIGGVTVSLRLLVPYAVTFILRILSICTRKSQQKPQSEQQMQENLCKRFKAIIQRMPKLLYNILVDLNVFPAKHFGSKVDRITAKRLGQWSTRLYIVSLLSFSILILYIILQPQSVTKIYNKPSLDLYNYLSQRFHGELKCPCSSIASTYDRFIHLEVMIHPICSSPFASNEWRTNLTANLVQNLSVYAERDYRRFLSAHLQYLHGLCQIANETIENFLQQFHSTLFITSQVLSENDFNQRVNPLIIHTTANLSKTITPYLFLIRNINHGNAIISTYGTNFRHRLHGYTTTDYRGKFFPTQPIIYDNDCSCGLHSNCTSQATFFERDSSENVPVRGLKIGCTPSESFHASTLECFYDQSCLDLIQTYANYSNPTISLSTTTTTKMNRFSINTTIDELINDLFIDQWSKRIDYLSYYKQCSPLLCSYTYIGSRNLLYTITMLLGFRGGLSIVLRWICPRIVYLTAKIVRSRKKPNTIVPTKVVNINVQDMNSDLQIVPSCVTLQTDPVSPVRCSVKALLNTILLLFLIIALIMFSIYIRRPKDKKSASINSSMNISTSTIFANTTTSITTMKRTLSPCPLKFQVRTLYSTDDGIYPGIYVLGDFNNDNQLDLAFYKSSIDSIIVRFGNNNGTFRKQISQRINTNRGLQYMAVADFNRDNRLDLVVHSDTGARIGILLGLGNGSFETLVAYRTGYSTGLKDMTMGDFDNDGFLDIAVIIETKLATVGIFFGNTSGTFLAYKTVFAFKALSARSISSADFNGDGHLDISVCNPGYRKIDVFLGYGNRTFRERQESFTGGKLDPIYHNTGDFNNDSRPDVVVSYGKNRIGIMYGYGNGSFGGHMKFNTTGLGEIVSRLTISDLNSDGHLDVVVGQDKPYAIAVLLNVGSENFVRQTVFSAELFYADIHIVVGDLNDDGYPDIISSDLSTYIAHVLLNTGECQTIDFPKTTTTIS